MLSLPEAQAFISTYIMYTYISSLIYNHITLPGHPYHGTSTMTHLVVVRSLCMVGVMAMITTLRPLKSVIKLAKVSLCLNLGEVEWYIVHDEDSKR